MFYVLLALRAELRRRGAFTDAHPEPRLDGLLDLVALGTVADVVKLDRNNRMPGRAGPEAHPRGPHAAGRRGAVSRGRARCAQRVAASTSASRSGRA